MTDPKHTSVEPFMPGEYIVDELDARGWTQTDLAAILGLAPNVVNEIIRGKRPISPDVANGLGAALGTGPQVWLNIQSAYNLAKSKTDGLDDVLRRAKLYNRFDVRNMVRRSWIEDSSNVTLLETQICQFYGIRNIDDPIDLPHAARQSTDYGRETTSHLAWFGRVRNLAAMVSVNARYSDKKFDSLIADLKTLCEDANDTRLVPAVLADYGIRLVIVEHLPKTRLDGVTLWLDKHSPVIGLSMRFDRIDYFWFTLFHELFHIKNRDHECMAIGLYDDKGNQTQKPATEKRADSCASDALIAKELFDDFVIRKGGIYSNDDVIGFSLHNHVHPGILVGQLHHREQNWTHFNKFLVKVRSVVTTSTLTDGWGVALPA